jgi:GDPmannose 4,6-dehydratase
LIDIFRPDQLYYLAAHHHSSQSASAEDPCLWRASWTVHVQAFFHFLAAVKECSPASRIFYASSSRVFGQVVGGRLNETSPFRPTCFYGITKASGMMLADYFRRTYGLHVSCGILFNHESPLRDAHFVSQRVVEGLVALKTGRASLLQIGSLNACTDWGYAPDYTRAMQLMLEAENAGDFIVATGETHTVREMIEIAAHTLGVQWEGRVVESPDILKRQAQTLCGDSSRLREVTGWQPSVSFSETVRIMARAALARHGSHRDPPRSEERELLL